MNEIELIVDLNQSPPELESVEGFALSILKKIGVDDWRMGLMFTDDEGIRKYNREWRNKDTSTDVLSFVQEEGESIPRFPGAPVEAGDVVISLETVLRNAESWEGSYDEELRRVVVHGILHLNGMDHPGDDYDGEMLKLQEELLVDTGSLMKHKQ